MMRSETPRYPVDRYLVESSNKIEMVNIIDEDMWDPEPALRPEDEIILRKLHEMLQSTADDLKLLSGELSKHHQPVIQVKTLPTPLDEEFNEKIYIEELVKAKFHGYKIIDTETQKNNSNNNIVEKLAESISNTLQNKKNINTGVQVNQVPTLKKNLNRNLGTTRPQIVQISSSKNITDEYKLNNGKARNKKPLVSYDEMSYKYVEPKSEINMPQKALEVQQMPSINIRSELKEQKVLHLDIIPETQNMISSPRNKNNVAVISIEHMPDPIEKQKSTRKIELNYSPNAYHNKPARKVSKMSTGESSESNNVSSETHIRFKSKKPLRQKQISPKTNRKLEIDSHKRNIKKDTIKNISSLDEWKRKLNSVYGRQLDRKKTKPDKRSSPKKTHLSQTNTPKSPNKLNNVEYIPYSKLTLGGVRVSDIERELSDIPNKNDIALSPILDKILSSRENSFHNDSPKKCQGIKSPKILTTSDENLLQEVLDIEINVNKTSKDLGVKINETFVKSQSISNDSYDDDFEDEKSDNNEINIEVHDQQQSTDTSSESMIDVDRKNKIKKAKLSPRKKVMNLSFKNKVDIFEFVHSVDTQDSATQSNGSNKISLKETQTSPRNDNSAVQPIHNNLWPSIDPNGDVEKMFRLEKDFIKKMIIDEYGDLLEKNLNKPSTSKVTPETVSEQINVAASQKNTQTSPAHVKCVATSPTRTKTRTTSPFALSLTVDHQTSPIDFLPNEEELKVEIENDDLGITVNLSSPRFSLRLPQTSREVLSNLEHSSSHHVSNKANTNHRKLINTYRKNVLSSSSSVDGDYSSSELSSLGEVNLRFKKKMRKIKVPSISELSSSSVSKHNSDISGYILPLKSEGEVSSQQILQMKSKKTKRSDGEMSYGQIH